MRLSVSMGTVVMVGLLTVVSSASAGDPLVRPGKWNPKDAPPGWLVIETDHYQVQSQVSEAKARALAEHLESMLDLYKEILPFRKRIKMLVLKIFESKEAMLAYRPGATGAAAWYNKGQRELVAYDTGIVLGTRDVPVGIRLLPSVAERLTPEERDRFDALCEAITDSYTYDVARVLSHEGWHQYFHHYTVSWVPMPSWIDEGVGDYFFMATRDDQGGYRIGDINHGRLRVIQRALDDGTTVTFAELLDFEQADYYSNASVYYAQGWSMVHFLMQNENPRYRDLIPKLIEDFKDTKNFRKSSKRAFKGLKLEQLDREWIGWLLSQQPDDPLRDLAEEFGTRIRPEDLVTSPGWQHRYAWHRDKLLGDDVRDDDD